MAHQVAYKVPRFYARPIQHNKRRMASRNPYSHRDTRAPSLFDSYNGGGNRGQSRSPRPNSGYGYAGNGPSYGEPAGPGFRSATPNSKGQYSDAVMSSLESQNETELEGMSAKVKMLKDITVAIGDEIRDSSALAEKMNDTFEGTRVRLQGTMKRMMRMADRTGVGWKAWVFFFLAVMGIFSWVWLF